MNKFSTLKSSHFILQANLALATGLAAFPSLAAAQMVAPSTPDAGSILQQVEPALPDLPPSVGTRLEIKPAGGDGLPPTAPFLVSAIRITGNTLFETALLHSLVMDAEGKHLTLPQLQETVNRVAEYYHAHNYPLTRAIIPAQAIRNGVVQVEIIEAHFGEVVLRNKSRVTDTLLQDTISPLESGLPINETDLNRILLLLSDIPGVSLDATLKPGGTVGTSDLLIDATPVSATTGELTADTYGGPYTGRGRISGKVNFINPFHHGDVLSLSGVSSGSGINYGRIAYDSLLNGQGTRVGGSVSALRYNVGKSLAPLDANGTARIFSLWATHPLVRSVNFDLFGRAQYDWLQLRDHVDAAFLKTDRHLGVFSIRIAGRLRDTLLSGGVNELAVNGSAGRLGFDDRAAQFSDAATANTRGRYLKWTAAFSRTQRVGSNDQLYVVISGQWANSNLDNSEKMSAGGPFSVRAYDVGTVSGDAGYQFTGEWRHDLGTALRGQWQAVAFVDTARLTINKSKWAAGPNRVTLSGTGLGLNWSGPKQWSVRSYVATSIGPTSALVRHSNRPRIGFQVRVGF